MVYLFFFLVLFTSVLAGLLLFLGKIFSKKKNGSDREFQSPFECGFSSFEEFRLPFSIHFFLVALLFVLFDVELVIMFPLMMEISFSQSVMMNLVYISFVVLLTLGLFNEWNQMALEWTK